MNVILLVIFSHHLFWLLALRQLRRCDLRSRFQVLAMALSRRDYMLNSLTPPATEGEDLLDSCVKQLLRQGKLQLNDLFEAEELWLSLGPLYEKFERQLLLILLHGGLTFIVALAGAALLQQELYLGVTPELLLALALSLYALYFMYRRLPGLPLASGGKIADEFLMAWFGLARSGPWQGELDFLNGRAQREGRSLEDERKKILRDWLGQTVGQFNRRLVLHEHALVLWELSLSLILGLCLWTRPLFERFGQLLTMG